MVNSRVTSSPTMKKKNVINASLIRCLTVISKCCSPNAEADVGVEQGPNSSAPSGEFAHSDGDDGEREQQRGGRVVRRPGGFAATAEVATEAGGKRRWVAGSGH